MLESLEGIVNIPDISGKTVDAILKCLYGQEVAAVCGDIWDVRDFLMAADKCQLDNLLWSGEQLLLRLPTKSQIAAAGFAVFTLGYRLNRPAILKHGVKILRR